MALPSYKEIVDLIKKGATFEAQEQIMALREAAIELQEENLALRERVKVLEEQQKIKAQAEFDGSVYWLVEGANRMGPFCQRCLDVDQKLVRLQDWDEDVWVCHACKMHPPRQPGRR